MFEVWLWVMCVVEQKLKASSSTINLRLYFTHKMKTTFKNALKGNPWLTMLIHFQDFEISP